MDRTGEPVTNPHDPGLLAAYVEGRLDEAERRAMTVHLGACADCRQALAMLARATAVLPLVAKRRLVAPPLWLALAATVMLATFAVRRLDGPRATDAEKGRPSPAGGVASATAPPPPSHPPMVKPGPRGSVPAADPLRDPGLLVTRGLRQAGGKSFRLMAGEWVDTGFDSTASLPTVLIKGPDERAAIVRGLPTLGPYAALGARVVVVFDGTVYRFAP